MYWNTHKVNLYLTVNQNQELSVNKVILLQLNVFKKGQVLLGSPRIYMNKHI